MIIIIEKSGSATITTHSQPPIPRGREKGQKSIRAKYFFFLFSAYKNVKSFYTGKIANHSYTRQVKCPLIGDLIVVLYVVCTHQQLIVCRVLDAQSDEQ